MLSRVLSIPFFALGLISLYKAWEGETAYVIFIIVAVLLLAIIFVMQPQIDWWWYIRHPPSLPKQALHLIEKHIPFYRRLAPSGQLRFRQRVALVMMAKDFKPMVGEYVQEEVKLAFAINAVQLTFGREDFLFDGYDTVVIYPHPFPSPQIPDVLHHSETYHEDKVFVFSQDLLIQGTFNSNQFFNTGMYELAGLMIDSPFSMIEEFTWDSVLRISGISQKQFLEQTGLPELHLYQMALVCFFSFPFQFLKEEGLIYQELVRFLKINPLGIDEVKILL